MMRRRFRTVGAMLVAIFVTLVTVGTVPAFAAPWSGGTTNESPRDQDQQAPATLDDVQSPRGVTRDRQDDTQAPRGLARATVDDTQAPRGQDDQAPATLDDAQSPRGARA
jgi:hypothetical protein